MSKMIIENRSKVSDLVCLEMVVDVINEGRVSNNCKQYCYATRFKTSEGPCLVFTDLNKRSDRFVICDDKNI